MTADLLTSFMQHALELAKRGYYTVSPNPMVGCVIVKNNKMIGEGWHEFYGGPHAEINALKQAGQAAENASLFITLEPCCHSGKTPPCVSAIIQAKIKNVYIACVDPNPLISGKGIALLKQAGIVIHFGLCEVEARELNKIFFHFIIKKRPYVIAKWAMSLDGKTKVNYHDEKQISNQKSQIHTHHLRHCVDAILIGSATAIADNPKLTVRSMLVNKQPLRIVLASHGNLPFNLEIFNPNLAGKTIIVVTKNVNKLWLKIAKEKGIIVWQVKEENERIDLHVILIKLAEENISSLLVEGGETIHAEFFAQNLVDEVQVYLAPKIISKLNNKITLKNMKYEWLENNLLIRGEI